MLRLEHWVGGVALAFACASASAGMHQICYEGLPEYKSGQWTPNGIFGCNSDGDGYCTISPVSTGFISRSNPYPLNSFVQSAGTFRYFDFSSSAGTFTAKVEFFDGNSVKRAERMCTVNARGVYASERGHATSGAVLTGFSTDASGLATSGVWRLLAPAMSTFNRISVQAPSDFVAVGGGAMGTNTPSGAMITESTRYASYGGDQRSWKARTTEAGGAAQSHRTTAYVIGLHIEGIAARDLAPLLIHASGTTAPTTVGHPVGQATQPILGGSAVISGGFEAFASGGTPLGSLLGQLATVSAPLISQFFSCTEGFGGFMRCRLVTGMTGWRAESKDHVIAGPGWINTQMLALPLTINVGGTTFEVHTRHVTATSAVAAHPAADVGGLRGDFALTGVGATVDWRRFDQFGNQTAAGNLLWKLEPRADIGGASVASKDHIISSPASITAHAIGIRLVIPGSLPPMCIGC